MAGAFSAVIQVHALQLAQVVPVIMCTVLPGEHDHEARRPVDRAGRAAVSAQRGRAAPIPSPSAAAALARDPRLVGAPVRSLPAVLSSRPNCSRVVGWA